MALIKVKPSRGRSRRLVGDEEARLLAAADSWTKDITTAILDTGVRGGTLRRLQWSNVLRSDDGAYRFIIPADKTKTKRAHAFGIVSERLREILERRRLGPDGKELPPHAYVFGNGVGEQITDRRANDVWRVTCANAKPAVVDLNFHDVRGELASSMAEAGVPLHDVRDVLEHSSITMTDQYLRSRTSALDDALRAAGSGAHGQGRGDVGLSQT